MTLPFPDEIEIRKTDLALSNEFGRRWSEAITNLAKVLDVPVAIIFKKELDKIHVISTNQDVFNPFEIGDSIPIDGSFCNYVMQRDGEFLVPDYRDLDLDIMNVATEKDFISYLGFPLKWPNGEIFGTICLLDNKLNYYSGATTSFLKNFRDLLTDSLALIETNYDLEKRNSNLEQKVEMSNHHRGTVPLCPHCQKIKLENNWIDLFEFQHFGGNYPLFTESKSHCETHHHLN